MGDTFSKNKSFMRLSLATKMYKMKLQGHEVNKHEKLKYT